MVKTSLATAVFDTVLSTKPESVIIVNIGINYFMCKEPFKLRPWHVDAPTTLKHVSGFIIHPGRLFLYS